MATAQRPEPPPALRHQNASSYDEALRFLKDESLGRTTSSSTADALKSLAIPAAASSVQGAATAQDVARLLWHCKPHMAKTLLKARIDTLENARIELETIHRDVERQNQASPTMTSTSSSEIVLRHLRINDGNVTTDDLMIIAATICGHATMASLALQANQIQPVRADAMKRFGIAVSLSNLRVLELTNNPIGTRSVCQFLDNLRLPCLTRLYLSMTMMRVQLAQDRRSNELWTASEYDEKTTSEEVWKCEMEHVTERLIRLVQPDPKTAPFAPQLVFVSLNGNDLGWKCVKRLVRAIRQGSRCMEEIGLFSTLDDDVNDQDDESDDEEMEPIRRVNSIGRYWRAQRAAAHTAASASGSTTPPRSAVLPSKESEKAEKITRQSWRRILNTVLSTNQQNKTKAKDASRKLLRIARTLTCKSHEGRVDRLSKADIFPFARLPAELRQAIVKHTDEANTLSNEQVERILSFASDPSTIGYGQRSIASGLSSLALRRLERDMDPTSDLYGLLLHKPFHWHEMITNRSVPRDWPATVWDEVTNRAPAPESGALVLRRDVNPNATNDVDEQASGGGGGGGGARGMGAFSLPSEQRVSAVRRIWLDEQPGLQAFWEATGTLYLEG